MRTGTSHIYAQPLHSSITRCFADREEKTPRWGCLHDRKDIGLEGQGRQKAQTLRVRMERLKVLKGCVKEVEMRSASHSGWLPWMAGVYS